MQLDDEVCLCFHVTRRKVTQFVRVNRPERASQLSECFGAGTGCGWCRPFLEKIFEQQRAQAAMPNAVVNPAANQTEGASDELPDATQYAQSRAAYRAAKKSAQVDL
jgi:bacterioferritin-associated ferredoxin